LFIIVPAAELIFNANFKRRFQFAGAFFQNVVVFGVLLWYNSFA